MSPTAIALGIASLLLIGLEVLATYIFDGEWLDLLGWVVLSLVIALWVVASLVENAHNRIS